MPSVFSILWRNVYIDSAIVLLVSASLFQMQVESKSVTIDFLREDISSKALFNALLRRLCKRTNLSFQMIFPPDETARKQAFISTVLL